MEPFLYRHIVQIQESFSKKFIVICLHVLNGFAVDFISGAYPKISYQELWIPISETFTLEISVFPPFETDIFTFLPFLYLNPLKYALLFRFPLCTYVDLCLPQDWDS